MPAAKGQSVQVHYRGTLVDGTEFDSSSGREPLEFTLGEEQVIAGFDQAVQGMEIGDRKTVTVPAEDAYGPRHEEALQTVPRELFGEEEPSVGDIIGLTAQDGNEFMATVAAIGTEEITLDFNHPLAGEDLTFDLELVGIG
jgi:peptidylprolyl isomerase